LIIGGGDMVWVGIREAIIVGSIAIVELGTMIGDTVETGKDLAWQPENRTTSIRNK